MAVTYKKLWHMLLDRNMKKKDLREEADLTNYTIRKLTNDEAVTTDTLAKICRCLECTVDDIMEDMDIMLIRLMEEYCTIKRLVAHEFGHAIAYSYHLEEDVIIKSLYEKYKHGFENMQEFIAECFMASELTNEVTLSNNVKNRINEIAEVKN